METEQTAETDLTTELSADGVDQMGPAAGSALALPADRWNAICTAYGLSGREQQLLECMLNDYSDAETAVQLGISIHTVRTYTERLYRKVRAHSRRQVVLRLFAHYVSLDNRRPRVFRPNFRSPDFNDDARSGT